MTTLFSLVERLKGQNISISEFSELLGLKYSPKPKDREIAEPDQKIIDEGLPPGPGSSAIRPTNYPPDKAHFRFPCLYALEEKIVEDTRTMPAEYASLIPFEGAIEFPPVADEVMPDPLTGWNVLWPYLKRLGIELKQTRQLDTKRIIQSAVRQKPLEIIPWKKKRAWPLDMVLVLDFSKHLSPFFNDFKDLALNMDQWFRNRLHIVACPDPKTNTFWYQGTMHKGFPIVRENLHLIYAGDLGFLDKQGINAGFWHGFGRRMKQKHVRIDALVTAHPSDGIPEMANVFSLHYWDSGVIRPGGASGNRGAGPGMKSRDQTEMLLAALSLAVELTPALIRRVRNRLGFSVSTESLACRHFALEGNVFRFQWRNPEIRAKYSKKAQDLNLDLDRIWSLIQSFESRMPMELRIEQRQKAGKPLDGDQADFLKKLILFQRNTNTPETEKNRIMAWVGRVADRAGEETWVPELNTLYGIYNETVKPQKIPGGVDLTQVPEWVVKSRETGPVCLSVHQNRLEIFSSGRPSHHPGLIHELSAGSKSQVIFRTDEAAIKQSMTLDKPFELPENTVEIVVETDTGRTTVAMMPCPEWASGIGRDRYGLFVEVKVKGIGFVLRWIPPGNFMMGSPGDEPERNDDEGPLHRVAFQKGFWLAETACTQDLWQAVTGKNPSRFKEEGLELPVENVSWDDANEFIDGFNHLVPGLDIRLPSEAEWEYACRAGTDTPFWFGWELNTDRVNYNGNYPYNNGPKGEYRQKTVPVKFFEQNPWGLYQMHGNVWEWCQDRWHDNYDGAPDDGSVWEDGDNESPVCRGGSWISLGRHLRSAYRNRRPLADLGAPSGLRLARGPLVPEAGTGRSRTGYGPGAARDEQIGTVTPAGGARGDSQ
ncbi:MAG: formylglycine-generating enzyme family protein [Desulfobacter postgatei]|uniref:formylglycine-generating enzyme family protein n=1 Tax=Desulfobacter postgatei TaxID=2293 RepID=UPI0023F2502E|nr:formylglycine-generating enzyme family protein [Desulfobacter postgatei]MDD4274405.1 formylglycine-generating enzyme family protein [Desulfobacter postgatei]